MPSTPHIEKHFTGSQTVRDVVIGMADGLTVPFALAAGLSAAVASTAIVVTAGLAEIVAGSIAMGLGGYLAARTDTEHYTAEEAREYWEVEHLRHKEIEETEEIFQAAKSITVVGVYCSYKTDHHIWGALSRTEAKIYYLSPSVESQNLFREWAATAKKKEGEHFVIKEKRFKDGFEYLRDVNEL